MAGNVDLDVRNLQSRFNGLDSSYRELFDYVLEIEKVLELIAEGKDITDLVAVLKAKKPRRR
jgi:hypothetical protein